MDWKLFLSTFVLIFIAELGDKTQLVAMARAGAGDQARWVVFAAAASALVLSTLVAVLVGGALGRLVSERTINMVAGTLFVVIGGWILYQAWRPAPAVPSAAPVHEEAVPVGRRWVVDLAVAFEERAQEDYRKLAEKASDPSLAALFRALADEEGGHGDQLRHHDAALAEARSGPHGAEQQVLGAIDQCHASDDDRALIAEAIRHEEALGGFYERLADTLIIPSLAQAFRVLAGHEREHVVRLQAWQPGDASSSGCVNS